MDRLCALGDQIIALPGHAHALANKRVGLTAQVANIAFQAPPADILNVITDNVRNDVPWCLGPLTAPPAPVPINRVVHLGIERISTQCPQLRLLVGDANLNAAYLRVESLLVPMQPAYLKVEAVAKVTEAFAFSVVAKRISSHEFPHRADIAQILGRTLQGRIK